jgi:hypothetical protein
MKYIYTLYRTERIETGEYYIGIHKINIEKYPDYNDGYLGSGNRIKASVKKYGKKAFKRTILVISDDLKYIDSLEEQMVDRETLDDPLCLNVALGGSANVKGRIVSNETRKKIGEAGKLRKGIRYEKQIKNSHTPECEQKRKETRIINGTWWKSGKDNVSNRPEVKKKISDSKIGKGATWQLGENNSAKRPEVREKISAGLKEYKFQGWFTNGIKNTMIKAKTEDEFIKKVNEFESLGYTKGKINAFKR